MALRLLEIVLPSGDKSEVERIFENASVKSFWSEEASDGDMLLWKVLVAAEKAETVLDALEKRFSSRDEFLIVVLPVEASLPREAHETEQQEKPEKQPLRGLRMSREELYNDVVDFSKITGVFLTLVLLSSVVAAAGILRDNVAIVLGAMVIAPLLGPNVSLSFATALGDTSLAWRSLKTAAAGIAVALSVALITGFIMEVDPTIPEIASRTHVSIGDVVLALASGVAGALAFTTGVPTALIGVMIALALLPPLVTFGLLLSSGLLYQASNALVLFIINILCVNLSGVGTFLVQGIRPLTWWEAARAKKATRRAISIWLALLIALVVMIMNPHFLERVVTRLFGR